jgi:hypothetical protein
MVQIGGKGARSLFTATLLAAGLFLGAPLAFKAAPPVISNVQVTGVTDTQATITWTTDVPSDSRVDYGLTTPFVDFAYDSEYVTAHSLTLNGLETCRQYYFSVTSTNGDGSTTDDNGEAFYAFVSGSDCDYDLIVGPLLWKDQCEGSGSGGDGVADPGETLAFQVDVANATLFLPVRNVVVSLESLTAGVTVEPPSSTSPFDLDAWNGAGEYPKERKSFEVALGRALSCRQEVSLRLTVDSDQTEPEVRTVRLFVGSAPDLLSEDFTLPEDLDQHPTGWSVEDGGDAGETWTRNNAALCNRACPTGITAPFEILDSDCFGGDGIQNDGLVTPAVDCSQADFVELVFDTLYFSVETGIDEARVEVSGDGGTNWSTVAVWRTTVGEVPSDPSEGGGGTAKVHLDLTPWAAGQSQVKVRFRYVGEWGWYWYVDDVRIKGRSSSSACSMELCCGLPSGPLAPNVTDVNGPCADEGVQITWNPDPSGEWGDGGMDPLDRRYAVYRSGALVEGGIPYGTTSVVDTGGGNGVAYDYTVKYLNTCGEEASSAPATGTDVYAPAAPTISGFHANVCPDTAVVLTTESGMSGYQWRKDGNPVGTDSASFTATEGGTYTVSYTNGSGCSGTSAGHAVTLTSCAAAPVADGRDGTEPLRVAKGTGGSLTVTYDVSSCPASQGQYNLLYGNLSGVSTYAFSGSVCGVDTDGSHSWSSPPEGNLFFLVVAENGTLESSWGKKRTGAGESERSTSPSGLCGSTAIDTTSTCP